jgi:cytochrome d ubiquinol oxidase subunit II
VEALHSRALQTAQLANVACILLLGLAVWMTLPYGLKVNHTLLAPQGPSNPLYKAIAAITTGPWLRNIQSNGLESFTFFYALPALFALTFMGLMIRLKPLIAFALSSLNILMLIATFGWLTFPIMLPSSTHLAHSLLVWDASSSKLTLFVMLLAAGVFVPIILAYTSWVYKVLAGPIKPEDITQNTREVY